MSNTKPIHSAIYKAIANPVSEVKAGDLPLCDPCNSRVIESNRLQGMMAHAFGFKGCPVDWVSFHDNSRIKLKGFFDELDSLAVKLRDAGIPLVLIENGSIARASYPCRGCFAFGDLDVIVDKWQLMEAHQVLLENGYNPSSADEGGLPNLCHGRAEYEKNLSVGLFRLNVQWSLVARRWFTGDREPRFDELLSHSEEIDKNGVRILGPEHNLFQLCLHNTSHLYIRKPGVRLHLDVERLIRSAEINWDAYISLVIRFHQKTASYITLLMSKLLFETPVPESVLQTLRPSNWKEKQILRIVFGKNLLELNEVKFAKLEFLTLSVLTYDNVGNLVRAVFPRLVEMRRIYVFQSALLLPYFYTKRIILMLRQ